MEEGGGCWEGVVSAGWEEEASAGWEEEASAGWEEARVGWEEESMAEGTEGETTAMGEEASRVKKRALQAKVNLHCRRVLGFL